MPFLNHIKQKSLQLGGFLYQLFCWIYFPIQYLR